MPMFVRKRWGWGIAPGDWRGWLLTAGYCVAMAFGAGALAGPARVVALVSVSLAYLVFIIWAFAKKI